VRLSVNRSIFGRSGGLTFLGVGPWLLLGVTLAVGPHVPATGSGGSKYPDEFPLFPTMGNEGASGMAYLRQPWSPFGVSVDEYGRVEYDFRVSVRDLPRSEGDVYRVWLTTPTLELIVDLGAIEPTGELTGTTAWHQLVVVVSREPADRIVTEGERWSGPIVLRGFSAGARVIPLATHSIFQPTPM
jgi:hypothetical protein